jgi:hypothetical protein
MRIGAMWSPPGKGGLMDGPGRCALAAASDAIGIAPYILEDGQSYVNYWRLEALFPVLDEQAVHPVDGTSRSVIMTIWSLNDTHGWSRPRIANWLEGVEKTTPAPVAVAKAVRS